MWFKNIEGCRNDLVDFENFKNACTAPMQNEQSQRTKASFEKTRTISKTKPNLIQTDDGGNCVIEISLDFLELVKLKKHSKLSLKRELDGINPVSKQKRLQNVHQPNQQQIKHLQKTMRRTFTELSRQNKAKKSKFELGDLVKTEDKRKFFLKVTH